MDTVNTNIKMETNITVIIKKEKRTDMVDFI
jgi:hypothetical protein